MTFTVLRHAGQRAKPWISTEHIPMDPLGIIEQLSPPDWSRIIELNKPPSHIGKRLCLVPRETGSELGRRCKRRAE